MSTLNTKPLEVFGGQQWMKLVPVEGVSSITYDANNAPTAITLNTDYEWIDIYHTMETCVFSESSLRGIIGTAWHQEIAAFLPDDDAQLVLDLEQMVEQRWIVATNDFHDRLRITGSMKNGCQMKVEFDSKSKVSQLKGTVLKFMRDDRLRVRPIASSVLFP